MTLPMARELAGSGIRVVTVTPGIFLTPMLAGLPAEAQASLGKQVPFLRASAAEEVCKARPEHRRERQRRDHPARRRHPHGAAVNLTAPPSDADSAARDERPAGR